MSNTLSPYPISLQEPARILLSKVRGGDVSMSEVVHAAYQVQGVALGNLLPDNDNTGYGTREAKGSGKGEIWDRPDGMKCECPTDEQEAILARAAGEQGKQGLLDNVFFKKLLAIALQYLTQYLAGE